MKISYKKFIDGKIENAPINDLDGTITGKCILNLKAYFDENPEERIALGYIKILDDGDEFEYDSQTQLVTSTLEKIDDYTAKVVYRTIQKSEEMMLFDELAELSGVRGTVIYTVTH